MRPHATNSGGRITKLVFTALGFAAALRAAAQEPAPEAARDEPPTSETAERTQEADEEIVIRGRRSLFTLRKEVETAREHVWAVFNEINSNDDFDISCDTSARSGTRMTRRACRPKYANDATSRAGKDLTRRIHGCDPTSPGYAICLEQAMQNGGAEAQQQIAIIAAMDRRLDDEFRRLVRERPELTTAVYEFLVKEREYKDATGARQE